MFPQIALALAPYLAPVVVSLLLLFVVSFINKLPANQRALITKVVDTSVSAVEQAIPCSPGDTKEACNARRKATAIQFVEEQLAHCGLRGVPMSVLDPMIESAVLDINLVTGTTASPVREPVPTSPMAHDKVPMHEYTRSH